ncbi:MAG: hypothetical protein HYV26_19425 [Candidatus Hydrogenedentes bacterium]|nr:hypothetical protein [Candidatus Hydrogenedentota bacterium]
MAEKVVAIAHGQAALQLGLTGLPVHEVNEIGAVETMLTDLMESEAQVLIVDERFRGQFSEWFSNRLARHSGLPLIIFVPSFGEEDAGTDAYINAILKPAVGFEIRLD